MTRVWRRAPCKVNLTLDVGQKRADGFHDIDSLVATFLPGDRVGVWVENVVPNAIPADVPDAAGNVRLIMEGTAAAPGSSNDTNDPNEVPADERNLAHRAARLFLERFAPNERVRVHVHLAKRLPAQAGLGGGSSDAAAVLRTLADLLPGPAVTTQTLSEVAARLGSDVPLFLCDAPFVRMRGRGEQVEPVLPNVAASLFGVLVRPAVGVPTGPAYALLDALPHRAPGRAPGRATGALFARLQSGETLSPEELAPLLGNNFEAAVLPAFPEVAEAHEMVTRAGALRALLCGSGSAVFGLARSREHARELARALCGRLPWVKMARQITQQVTQND